jgi:transglutaminase/protease-like cytokinesis protein 3
MLPATPVVTEPTEPVMAVIAPESEPEKETATESFFTADVYDYSAILAAWESDDWDSLTEKNRAVLELAAEVIDENITVDMEDHEKELFIHDWLCERIAYDEALMSNGPDIEPTPDNNNPYGAMILETADCEGYTLSFQLFMDLLGIECVTVYGTDLWGYEPHAWNVVRLSDGEWYCVDVTWDDTADVTDREDAPINHKFFNVTSDFMFQNDHQWDRETIPEATSDKFEQD